VRAFLLALLIAAGAAAAGELRTGLAAPSPALGRPLPYALRLPAGWDAPGARFPLVLLLHGYAGGVAEWSAPERAAGILDRLEAAGRIAPVIAAIPEAGVSWYVDSAALGGPGDYETAIAVDLVDHLDAAWPTRPGRAHRAVMGNSMGGWGALRLALFRPDRFGAAVALSPAVFTPGGASEARWPLGHDEETRQFWFPGVFGRPFDPARYAAAAPDARLDALAAMPDPPRLMLASGDDDHLGFELGTVELFAAMRARGIAVELRIGDGGHGWDYWARAAEEGFLFLDAGWPPP
jgi:enterochelin esterase family protein